MATFQLVEVALSELDDAEPVRANGSLEHTEAAPPLQAELCIVKTTWFGTGRQQPSSVGRCRSATRRR
ncbi:hypothetical protein JOD67_006912 [Tenggerimyces flavus]|nr:hypothetical protein [Tenggerimyces flavus]